MKQEIPALREEAKKEIELVSSLGQLDELRIKYMGKKGKLTDLSKGMKDLSVEEKPVIGQLINEAKNEILEALAEKNASLVKEQREKN
ncbi:Phenylalanine--tRNA ligase alpha subunit [Fusobacterium necrophorum subsp. necrophorum]|nr:Phenylalanine--tRNA ligase alpha subunit [Fusobacterium necrophorum subsp. necrophorum]